MFPSQYGGRRYQKQCERKHGYPNRKEVAKVAAMRAKEMGCPMFYYKCPACRLYHITRDPQ